MCVAFTSNIYSLLKADLIKQKQSGPGKCLVCLANGGRLQAVLALG